MCSKAYRGRKSFTHTSPLNLAAKQISIAHGYSLPFGRQFSPIQPRCAARHSGVRATRNLTFLYVAD